MTRPALHHIAIALLCCGVATACTLRSGTPSEQQKADRLAEEYQDCVHALIQKTSREKYVDRDTRRRVVLESCEDKITAFNIVQEQAYSEACAARGQSSTVCDEEAVRKARSATTMLEQEARRDVNSAPIKAY